MSGKEVPLLIPQSSCLPPAYLTGRALSIMPTGSREEGCPLLVRGMYSDINLPLSFTCLHLRFLVCSIFITIELQICLFFHVVSALTCGLLRTVFLNFQIHGDFFKNPSLVLFCLVLLMYLISDLISLRS